METAPIIDIPMKFMKHANMKALESTIQQRCRLDNVGVPPAAARGADKLEALRSQLESTKELSPYNAEAAARLFLRYNYLISELEIRFDDLGTEMGLLFKWKDAFDGKKSSSFEDLQWDRVGVLFNAAAVSSFLAKGAAARGTQSGGIKESAKYFQEAAWCLQEAHQLVTGAVMGLNPRWPPSKLTADVSPPMLDALQCLMLAQAQRALYEKACAENLGASLKAKLAAGAAKLFGDCARKIRASKDLVEAVEKEGGMFSRADKTFLGRVDASRLYAEACAEECDADLLINVPEDQMQEYGKAERRLRSAVEKCEAAMRAAMQTGVEKGDLSVIEKAMHRLAGVRDKAIEDNRLIGQERVPDTMPDVEGQIITQPTPPMTPQETDDDKVIKASYASLMPETARKALQQHHADVCTRSPHTSPQPLCSLLTPLL